MYKNYFTEHKKNFKGKKYYMSNTLTYFYITKSKLKDKLTQHLEKRNLKHED